MAPSRSDAIVAAYRRTFPRASPHLLLGKMKTIADPAATPTPSRIGKRRCSARLSTCTFWSFRRRPMVVDSERPIAPMSRSCSTTLTAY